MLALLSLSILLSSTRAWSEPGTPVPSTSPASVFTTDPAEAPLEIGLGVVVTIEGATFHTEREVAIVLEREAAAVLVERGFQIAEVGARERVRIRVTQRGAESTGIKYELIGEFGKGVARPLHAAACDRCGSDELIAAVRRDIGELGPDLERAVTSVPTPAASAAPAPRPQPTDHAYDGNGLGPLMTAGFATLGVGVAFSLGSIGFLEVYRKRKESGHSDAAYKIPGVTLLVVGASLMTAGVVLLAVDTYRLNRGIPPRIRRKTSGRDVAWGVGHARGATTISLGFRW